MKKSEAEKNNWDIRYHPRVLHEDLPSLEKSLYSRVEKAITQKLLIDPLLYGSPLHGVLTKLFKLRIGDFRIVYTISKGIVNIIMIGHRRHIYQEVLRRLG